MAKRRFSERLKRLEKIKQTLQLLKIEMKKEEEDSSIRPISIESFYSSSSSSNGNHPFCTRVLRSAVSAVKKENFSVQKQWMVVQSKSKRTLKAAFKAKAKATAKPLSPPSAKLPKKVTALKVKTEQSEQRVSNLVKKELFEEKEEEKVKVISLRSKAVHVSGIKSTESNNFQAKKKVVKKWAAGSRRSSTALRSSLRAAIKASLRTSPPKKSVSFSPVVHCKTFEPVKSLPSSKRVSSPSARLIASLDDEDDDDEEEEEEKEEEKKELIIPKRIKRQPKDTFLQNQPITADRLSATENESVVSPPIKVKEEKPSDFAAADRIVISAAQNIRVTRNRIIRLATTPLADEKHFLTRNGNRFEAQQSFNSSCFTVKEEEVNAEVNESQITEQLVDEEAEQEDEDEEEEEEDEENSMQIQMIPLSPSPPPPALIPNTDNNHQQQQPIKLAFTIFHYTADLSAVQQAGISEPLKKRLCEMSAEGRRQYVEQREVAIYELLGKLKVESSKLEADYTITFVWRNSESTFDSTHQRLPSYQTSLAQVEQQQQHLHLQGDDNDDETFSWPNEETAPLPPPLPPSQPNCLQLAPIGLLSDYERVLPPGGKMRRQPLAIRDNFIAWLADELEVILLYLGVSPGEIATLYQLPNRVIEWSFEQVAQYITVVGFPPTAQKLLRHEVDGFSLMLLGMSELTNPELLGGLKDIRLLFFLARLHQNLPDAVLPMMMMVANNYDQEEVGAIQVYEA